MRSIDELTPVLVYTDDGRDVDDVTALAYLAGSPHTEIVSVVTTHAIPDRRAMIARAFLSHLGLPDVPIGVGSIFPMGQENEPLVGYLREHTLEGRTYEGDGLIECFPSAEEVILGAIRKYGKSLRIAALAPLTDLAKFAQAHPEEFDSIGGLFFQGQATIENGQLVPDPQAYNVREDQEAAKVIFGHQAQVPMTLVGKHAAYQVPLSRADFARFAATGNPAGKYLETHAIKGLRCFAERAPGLFERVFRIHPSQLDSLDELSKPYDALVAMAIADPDHFTSIHIGQHALIGMASENPGVTNPTRTKHSIMHLVLRALQRAR